MYLLYKYNIIIFMLVLLGAGIKLINLYMYI